MSIDGALKEKRELLDMAVKKGYELRCNRGRAYLFDPRRGCYDDELRCQLEDLLVWLQDMSFSEELAYIVRHPFDAELRNYYRRMLSKKAIDKRRFPEYRE